MDVAVAVKKRDLQAVPWLAHTVLSSIALCGTRKPENRPFVRYRRYV
jgi:hypothetical protein